MFVTPAEARALLVFAKARSLVMIDDKRAHSPFPWDKKFFKRLRPDQVPRFLRCLTDPQKLPKRWFELSDLSALQNRVDVEKVDSIRSTSPTLSAPVIVRIREDDPWTIADGLHRSTANWLDHVDRMEAFYCDLSDKHHAVEPVPGAGRFDSAAAEAEFRLFDKSEIA